MEHLSKEREDEKVSDKSCRLKVDQDICSLFAAAITFEEDHANLQGKYDSISHTTSQKLAAPAAEPIACERQIKSSSPLTAEAHEAHEAAASHSAEVLRLQSALGSHHVTQTDLAQQEAEEASWSVLRAELTRRGVYMRSLHLEAARARRPDSAPYVNAMRPSRCIAKIIAPSSAVQFCG